ncbi:MAG: tetratricopeptide repeat protein [Geothrix sp.]|nr:tetratricopeptide repeat protein [Geothrix sp.]
MECLRPLRIAFLVFAAALASAAPAKAPVPAEKAPVSAAPASVGSLPAIALSHRVQHLMDALDRGDAKAVRAAQLEVEAFRRTYSTLDVAPLVEAVTLWARQQGMNGKATLGLEGLQAVERWAPDHPTLLGTRIMLMRQQGIQGWFWGFPDLLRLTRLRVLHPAHRWLWLIQHLGMLRLAATLLLWGWALTMGLRYRNALRHLWEEPLERRGVSPIMAAALGALILAGPVLLGLDPMVAAMVWLFLMAPFLLAAEVKVTALILLMQLVHPALAALEPWAAREPLPSILTLQLQPQVQPISPATVRLLPPSDRAFLTGWAQLQNQDWKAAAGTFQELVGRHPDQAAVLNNLGVALFQSGDEAGADKSFELALQAGPKMEVLLNQSILAFSRLDTARGATKQEEAQAAAPADYALLIALNDAQTDARTYPMPLPDTPERVRALVEAAGESKGTETHLTEPAFLVALLLPILGLVAFLARVRASVRMAHPTQCVRCGEPFHTTDSPDHEVCQKCHHLFVLRDGLHTENRRKKLDEVAAHQRSTRWIHKTLIVLLPGCDLAFLGETREGFIEFLPFCLAVGMVLATGRSVRYPGEIMADPMSIWLALGAILVGLFYLRSWLKLILRRA